MERRECQYATRNLTGSENYYDWHYGYLLGFSTNGIKPLAIVETGYDNLVAVDIDLISFKLGDLPRSR